MWAAVGAMGYGELLRPGRNQRPTGSPEDARVTYLDLRQQQGVTPLPAWSPPYSATPLLYRLSFCLKVGHVRGCFCFFEEQYWPSGGSPPLRYHAP